jgi:hypothetical protein
MKFSDQRNSVLKVGIETGNHQKVQKFKNIKSFPPIEIPTLYYFGGNQLTNETIKKPKQVIRRFENVLTIQLHALE